MKKIALDVAERLRLLDLLSGSEGNLTTLRLVRDLQRAVGFDEAETAALNFRQEGNTIRWDTAAGAVPRDFEVGDATRALVIAALKKLEARDVLTMAHLPLYEKFLEE